MYIEINLGEDMGRHFCGLCEQKKKILSEDVSVQV